MKLGCKFSNFFMAIVSIFLQLILGNDYLKGNSATGFYKEIDGETLNLGKQ